MTTGGLAAEDTAQAAPGLLRQASLLGNALADVSVLRERTRQRRLRRLAVGLALVTLGLWARVLTGHGLLPGVHVSSDLMSYAPAFVLVLLLGGAILIPML